MTDPKTHAQVRGDRNCPTCRGTGVRDCSGSILYDNDGRVRSSSSATTPCHCVKAVPAVPDDVAEPVAWLPTGTVKWLQEYNGPACATRTAAHNRPIKSDGGVPVFLRPAPVPAAPDDVTGTLAGIIPILDHEFSSRDQLILHCALGQITLGDVMDLRNTIEAQAAELARLREVLENEAYEFSERHEVSGFYVARRIRAALTHPTGEPT